MELTDLPVVAPAPPFDPRIIVRDKGSSVPELGQQMPLHFDPTIHGLPKDARVELFTRDPKRADHWYDPTTDTTYKLHPDFPFWQGDIGRPGQVEVAPETVYEGADFACELEYVTHTPDGREVICPDYDLAVRVANMFNPPAIAAPAPEPVGTGIIDGPHGGNPLATPDSDGQSVEPALQSVIVDPQPVSLPSEPPAAAIEPPAETPATEVEIPPVDTRPEYHPLQTPGSPVVDETTAPEPSAAVSEVIQ